MLNTNSAHTNHSAVQQTFYSSLFQAHVGWFAVFKFFIYVGEPVPLFGLVLLPLSSR
jgi:hypothetical protein